jgi:uncharacterized protein DUF6600/FecR-like protein
MCIRRLGNMVLVLAGLTCSLLALPVLADSQARIVRLSDVQGDVQIDRNLGQGYEKAYLNMPITQGAKLWAKDSGRAEIEFEDGSVLHIVPDTKIDFSELSLRDSGGKVSTVNLQEGTLYVNYAGKPEDQFTVKFGHESTTLAHPTHFRVEMDDTTASLAVFKGDVEVSGPSGSVEVSKNKSAEFDLANDDKYTLAKNYEQDIYDDWDKQQDQYHQRYNSSNSYGASAMPYGYGVSDLNYYGSYYNVPGYGYMWQPYFTGFGWDPFMNGAWMWYPGFGYTWVSSYPWGWMPYRYGSWMFVPNYGWMWQPGGWNYWNTVPAYTNPPQRFTPPAVPTAPGHGTVLVGKPPAGGPVIPPRRVIMTQGSAGLGVPRGGVANLPKISQRVMEQGSATVRMSPTFRSVLIAPTMSGIYGSGVNLSGSAAPMRGTAPHMSSPHMSAPHMSAPHVSAPSSSSKH